MPVAARFYVAEHTRTASGPDRSAKVVLVAVSRGDQNRQWAKYTPCGRVEMTINNPEAADWFLARLDAGDDVSVMFDAAPVKTPEDGHAFRLADGTPGSAYGPPYCGDCAHPEDKHTPAVVEYRGLRTPA